MCWLPTGATEIKFFRVQSKSNRYRKTNGSFKNGKNTTQHGRIDFCRAGYHVLYLDLTLTVDHVGHGKPMNHETTDHSVKLLGIGTFF